MVNQSGIKINKLYQHIFFDLDHTLWDFDKNSADVLSVLYYRHELDQHKGWSLEKFIEKFKEINYSLWDQYHLGEITKERIRSSRFPMIFQELNIPANLVPSNIAEDYLKMCPTQPHVIPFTFDVLDYLKDKYHLHIITNGFEDVQHIKMRSSGLSAYFETIITSESCGYIKPDKRMFEFALRETGAMPEDSLMIGDNLDVDINGAINAGMDAIYFNPYGADCSETTIRQIRCLTDLKQLL